MAEQTEYSGAGGASELQLGASEEDAGRRPLILTLFLRSGRTPARGGAPEPVTDIATATAGR
jgi:hypothetical protein